MSQFAKATFRFGPVRQEAGAKHVRQGDLLEAINVRQTAKAGVYAKRKAFQRTPQTFAGGSLSRTPETALPGTSANSLMRDTGDQLWARAASTNTWNYSGVHRRPWVDVTTVQSNVYTTPQPFSCIVGSSLWVFALTTNAYEFSILDAASGSVTGTKVTVTATGIVHASAAYDGAYVWLIWVDNGANGTVRCHKITAATPTVAPTATTYYNFPAVPTDVSAVRLQQVQARYFSAAGKVFVCACGGSFAAATYKRAAMHSVLNPATGAATVGGAFAATVSYAVSSATAPHTIGGLYILDGQDGSGTYWYYTFYNWDTATSAQVLLNKVTASNIPTFTATSVCASGGLGTAKTGNTSGFVDNASNAQYVMLTERTNAAFVGWSVFPIETRFSQVNAGVVTSATPSVSLQYAWVASGFAHVGSRWYFLTGFDDWTSYATYMGTENLSLQRCFHVREFVPGASVSLSTYNIVGQFGMGQGPALWHASTGAANFPSTNPAPTCTPTVSVVNNSFVSALALASGATGYVDVAYANVNTAKTYGQSVQVMGMGFSPGNIPITWSSVTPPHEVAPLTFPPFIIVSGGAGTDYSICAAVYAIYDNNGVIWRSAPQVLSTTIGHGAGLSCPAPMFNLPGTQMMVEVYLGNNGTPKLQAVVPVVGNVNNVMLIASTPLVANMVNGETLYTTGNALSQTWPVSCQSMGTWNNRLFFAQKNRIWVSKELEPGFGPLFNEVQTSIWNEERNDITAIAPVDWNYLGIASADQVAVISGPGPDGVGNGNYVIKTLPSYTGVAAGGIALQGSQGMYYQNKGTGRIMCLHPSLQVMEAAGGAYDYASYSFSAAAWYESENLMVFFAPASGAAIAIDYQHPQDVAPFGQVYLWTFAAGFVPATACRDDSGLLVVSSQGDVYRTTTNQWVDDNNSGTTTDTYQMKLTSAELQLGDLQGSFNLDKAQTLLTMRGVSGVSIGVYPGYASPTASDSRTSMASIDLPAPINSGDTESVMTRPPNCMRIQSFRVVILEKAGVTTQSFEFEGVAVECHVTGRLLRPSEGRVI